MNDYNFPKVAEDLEIIEFTPLFRKQKKYLIGSRSLDSAFVVYQAEKAKDIFSLCKQMDGTQSLEQLESFLGTLHLNLTLSDYIQQLSQIGLIIGEKAKLQSEVDIISKHIVTIRANNSSNFLYKLGKITVQVYPFFLLFLLGLSIFTLLRNGVDSYNFTLSFKSIALTTLILPVLMIIHELGHIITAYSLKVKVDSVRVSLRWNVVPILYTKYKELHFNTPQEKVKVLLGGCAAHVFCAVVSFALFVQWNVPFFWILTYANLGMILSSLYPHTLSDGYFLFLLLTDSESLRLKALNWIFLKDKRYSRDKSIILLVIMYIGLSLMGVVSIFIFFQDTIKSFCNYLGLNFTLTIAVLSILYYSLFFISILRAKKRLNTQRVEVC